MGSFYCLMTVGMYTDMRGTKLDGASLTLTYLSHAGLFESIGLTQRDLDMGTIDSEEPPKLDNVFDAKMGEVHFGTKHLGRK